MSGQTFTSNHNIKSGKGEDRPCGSCCIFIGAALHFQCFVRALGQLDVEPAKPVDEETVAGVEQDRRGFDLAAEQARRRQWRLSIENASKFEREITLPK